MFLLSRLLAAVCALSIVAPALAAGHGGEPLKKRHMARVTERSLGRPGEFHLAKRFDGGRFSFYDAGLGACGQVNSGADYVSDRSSEVYHHV